MERDRYLVEAARAMIAAADRSQSVVAVLKRHCPPIYHQIRQLRECPSLLALWGRSWNVDENAGQVIVHPAILQAIGQLAEVPLRGRIVHAGLEHTYGYLFSLIETPYGYKRERWTLPTIEKGFGIRTPTLRDQPTAGTLLTNLTWFAGHIAFRDRPGELRRLCREAGSVSPVARDYDYAKLIVSRVVEEVTITAEHERSRRVQLRTDLVPFPCAPASREADSHLLVYSVLIGDPGRARLITAFPVTRSAAEDLTAAANQGEAVREGVPYNAWVAGLGTRPYRVRRQVVRMAGDR